MIKSWISDRHSWPGDNPRGGCKLSKHRGTPRRHGSLPRGRQVIVQAVVVRCCKYLSFRFLASEGIYNAFMVAVETQPYTTISWFRIYPEWWMWHPQEWSKRPWWSSDVHYWSLPDGAYIYIYIMIINYWKTRGCLVIREPLSSINHHRPGKLTIH